jgi:hypothetical protein
MAYYKLLAPFVVGVVLQSAGRARSMSVVPIARVPSKAFVRNSAASKYVDDVKDWLESENMIYTELSHRFETSSSNHTLYFLQLETPPSKSLLLHLLQSPTSLDECLPAGLTRNMTDNGICPGDAVHPSPVIHLHQDVWCNPHTGPIVRARLLCRQGRVASRIFARKTVVRRIDGPTATSFLQRHHLWGAIKAKYSYGLFAKNNQTEAGTSSANELVDGDEVLVAVATFSSRRHVQRGTRIHRSHELIRFCSRRDGTVVGGITKLLSAFVKDCAPDDIETVIDRDWGVGSTGWHPLGFETVAIMPPVVMAISANDGTRRHLVGAGIKPEEFSVPSTGSLSTRQDRIGLTAAALEELASIEGYDDALNCLDHHGFHPVHDAGVERLLMILPSKGADGQQQSVTQAWKSSTPNYAAEYYSSNAGINALLRNAGRVFEADPINRLALWRSPDEPATICCR